jgi:hypothetical protein
MRLLLVIRVYSRTISSGRFALLVLAGAAAAYACGSGSPASPTGSAKPEPPPSLQVACVDQPSLRCTAFVFGDGDVTAVSRWSAADSFRLALDVPVTAATTVDFPTPGAPRTLSPGNVYIRADYASPKWGLMRSIAPHAYRVAPSAAAVPLAYITGQTFVSSIGGIPLGGVSVEIVDGEGAGRRALTLEANGSYMIEFLRLNSPFTARASKPGYSSEVKSHPGIVDDSLGFPSNTALHFSLTLQ